MKIYQPSRFLAEVDTRQEGSRPRGGSDRISKLADQFDLVLSVSAEAFECSFLISGDTSVASHSDGGDVVVVFHGELYPDSDPQPARRCLNAYLRDDVAFLSALHGSFAMCIVDARQNRIVFVTDPVNSRQLFHSRFEGTAWVSTVHAFRHHPHSGIPDPAGIAHYLVNGISLNGLTPFDGVRVLGRASIHEFEGNAVTSKTYWQYQPEPGREATAESLGGDLRDAILGAVERRLPASGGACLSLSGGYDSTAVLGAFDRLGVTDVRCYTYRKRLESRRSDADIARKMSTVAGYPLTEIDAYSDDVGNVIDDNVRWGQGLTRLVVETDAWRALSKLLSADTHSTFWVAEECFGMHPPRTLHDDVDVLNSLAFGDWSSLGPLRELFPRTAESMLDEALRAEMASLTESCRTIGDPYTRRDYLYLDQRLPRLLSWREAFAQRCGEVRNPLIDREILELRQQFPQELAVGKRLYKDTVRELFPDLFAIERAAAGTWMAGRWMRDAVRTSAEDLTRLVRANPSPLDPYLPPEGLLRAIGQEARRAGGAHRALQQLRGLRSQVRKRIRTFGRIHPPATRTRRVTVDPTVFTLRAITLREVLRRREAP